MIEQLENRAFCSAAPSPQLTLLRSDVASIGHIVNAMIVANKSAIANLQSDLSVIPTSVFAGNAELRLLNFRFRSQVANFANVYNNVKLLLGNDIASLINDCNAYNRNPVASEGVKVQAAQQLLTAQAATASATLSHDAGLLLSGYKNALSLIATSNPLNASVVTRVGHISTKFLNFTTAIDTAASTVAAADIPSFITSLEPDGIITAA